MKTSSKILDMSNGRISITHSDDKYNGLYIHILCNDADYIYENMNWEQGLTTEKNRVTELFARFVENKVKCKTSISEAKNISVDCFDKQLADYYDTLADAIFNDFQKEHPHIAILDVERYHFYDYKSDQKSMRSIQNMIRSRKEEIMFA